MIIAVASGGVSVDKLCSVVPEELLLASLVVCRMAWIVLNAEFAELIWLLLIHYFDSLLLPKNGGCLL